MTQPQSPNEPGRDNAESTVGEYPRISVPSPELPNDVDIRIVPDDAQPAVEPAPPSEPAPPKPAPAQKPTKQRCLWPRIALAAVAALFLATWLPVLVLRWVNPPTTAFMLETAAALPAHTKLHRTWVPYDKIAPPMRLAVVASEDQTFPTNHGFDFQAIQKAIQHNERGGTLHGASTITQQVAKNLFLWHTRSYVRKAIGAYFTVLIDFTWSKRRVLAVYLNIAQFGPHTFGVEAAAKRYFGKHASQLTADEAAMLAATLPDPDRLNPAHPTQYLFDRQAWILDQMRHLGGGYLSGL